MGGHLGLGSAGPACAFPYDVGCAHSHVWGISQSGWRRWRGWESWGHQGTWGLSLPLILQQESPVLFTWCQWVPRQKQERTQSLSLSHVCFHIPYIFKSLLLLANAPLANFTRPSPDSSGGEISSACWCKELQIISGHFWWSPTVRITNLLSWITYLFLALSPCSPWFLDASIRMRQNQSVGTVFPFFLPVFRHVGEELQWWSE